MGKGRDKRRKAKARREGPPVGLRQCYTQGIAPDSTPDGSYEERRLGALNVDQALAMVRMLGLPPNADACPPTFGIDEYGNVCREDAGLWVTWTWATGAEVTNERGVELFIRRAWGA